MTDLLNELTEAIVELLVLTLVGLGGLVWFANMAMTGWGQR